MGPPPKKVEIQPTDQQCRSVVVFGVDYYFSQANNQK